MVGCELLPSSHSSYPVTGLSYGKELHSVIPDCTFFSPMQLERSEHNKLDLVVNTAMCGPLPLLQGIACFSHTSFVSFKFTAFIVMVNPFLIESQKSRLFSCPHPSLFTSSLPQLEGAKVFKDGCGPSFNAHPSPTVTF